MNDCEQAKNTEEFLREECDIFIHNADTGSITGRLDAVGTKIKTFETIVPENSKVTHLDNLYRIARNFIASIPQNRFFTTINTTHN